MRGMGLLTAPQAIHRAPEHTHMIKYWQGIAHTTSSMESASSFENHRWLHPTITCIQPIFNVAKNWYNSLPFLSFYHLGSPTNSQSLAELNSYMLTNAIPAEPSTSATAICLHILSNPDQIQVSQANSELPPLAPSLARYVSLDSQSINPSIIIIIMS